MFVCVCLYVYIYIYIYIYIMYVYTCVNEHVDAGHVNCMHVHTLVKPCCAVLAATHMGKLPSRGGFLCVYSYEYMHAGMMCGVDD